MSGALACRRGCGTRIAGGIYLECGLSEGGRPIEEFLIDPPLPLPPDLVVAAQGVTLIERGGVWHVLDWVGASHYPNVADFVEEVRRFGLSRRIPQNQPFQQITQNSRIILVHSRAIVTAAAAYRPKGGEAEHGYRCPGHIDAHKDGGTMCAGMWWEDLEHGSPCDPEDLRYVERTMPSFSYHGRTAPEGAPREYVPGMFASFPLSRIAVVRDPAGKTHELAEEKAKKAWIPVELVDE
jgi:hypothetical protein